MGIEEWKELGLFLLGMTGIVKAVPVGVAMKLTIFETGLYISLGSVASVLILIFSGGPVKRWMMKHWGKDGLEKQKGKFSHILERYGLIGVGLIAPGTIGPIPAAIIGLIILKDTKKLLPYLIAGIFAWSFLLSWLAVSGFNLINDMF